MDFNSDDFFVYAAIGAGVVVVLAVILYLLPIGKIKLPAIVLSVLASLAAGAALGVLITAFFGYHWYPKPGDTRNSQSPLGGGGGAPMGMAPKAPGGGGGAAGGGGPGGGGGARGPSTKVQLTGLVTKLEVLTRAPLKIEFTEERRAKVAEQLKGLGAIDVLTDEEAKKRLDALVEILKDDHATLEAAGYRVPGAAAGGGRGGPGGPPPPNPFFSPEPKKALEDLEKRVTKAGPTTE
jgi:hypothetical protein